MRNKRTEWSKMDASDYEMMGSCCLCNGKIPEEGIIFGQWIADRYMMNICTECAALLGWLEEANETGR